jgi:signal transduction histidine kinase
MDARATHYTDSHKELREKGEDPLPLRAGLSISHAETQGRPNYAVATGSRLAGTRQDLTILVLEDSLADAELEVALLEEAGFACRWGRAQTREEFLSRLQSGSYDLILADYSLPGFDGLSALKLVRAQGLDVPFILVSGTVGEETAIESLKAGATDYVLKPRLSRLVPVVERALQEHEEHRHRRQAEEALRASEAELRRLNTELEQRVRERTAQLEASNRELEAFSYSVSHDLRAPLRIIESFSEALQEECGTRLDARGRHYLERVRAAVQRTQQLIADLLQLSRVNRSEMELGTVDVTQLARSIAAELQQTEPQRMVTFAVAESVVATADPRLLRDLLENLLGNAWKFTSRHPRARIDLDVTERDGGRVYFVRDNGAGFDMRFADQLFQPFKRLHGAGEFPGTGIGLATVQRIVHRHGGRVWAESAVDRGTTVYFTLAPGPIADCGVGTAEPAPRDLAVGDAGTPKG